MKERIITYFCFQSGKAENNTKYAMIQQFLCNIEMEVYFLLYDKSKRLDKELKILMTCKSFKISLPWNNMYTYYI